MKYKVLMCAVFTASITGCATIQDGEYLGGMVHVSGFSKPDKKDEQLNSEAQHADSKAEEKSQADEAPDYSAQANAQGVCWIGCKSKEPSPMESIEFAIPGVDVDTAYARIKREFDFKTRAERVEANPSVEGWLEHTLDFRYQVTTGVNYLMRSYTEHKYLTEETPNTIQVEIFKDGPNQVFIKASFYSGNTKDLTGYKNSLKNRIVRAAKG